MASMKPLELKKMLESEGGQQRPLMLDLRSFMSYNQSHIVHSLNICIPTSLAKRKSFSLQNLEATMSCPATKEEFQSRAGRAVVLIDTCSQSPDQNSILNSLFQKLLNEQAAAKVLILEGGFQAFSAQAPHLCTKKLSFSPLPKPVLSPSTGPAKEYGPELTPILDWLYLGSHPAALDKETLQKSGVTFILNTARECHDGFSSDPSLRYRRLDLDDSPTQTLSLSVLEEAFRFIDEAHEKGAKVLIHCRAGQSRSPTIVISYIMRTYCWNLQKSYHFVQARRPSISPNLGFVSQLLSFEKIAFGKESTNIQSLMNSPPCCSISPPFIRAVVSLPPAVPC